MRPGDVVGDRFELERLAGTGAMGRVFRAKDRVSGEVVALKTMHAHTTHLVDRFVREAAILEKLRHPAIVRHVAHGSLEGGPASGTPSRMGADDGMFLAMEWLEGESLTERLVREGLTVDETLDLAVRVAGALGEAHRHGVVHRDLKPNNLFLVGGVPSGVRVIDFGIARHDAGGADRELTGTGDMIGTPGYMAPEQARGLRALDARADLYALGSVLFKCLTGRAPFVGSDPFSILAKVVLEPAPRVRELRPEIPEALDALVSRLLAKAPDDRFPDAGALADALERVPRGLGAAPGAASSAAEAITGTEQRLACVVVARPKRASAADDHDDEGPTRVEPRQSAGEASLRAAADRFGGTLDVLADGSILVSIAGGDVATDQAARAARCAFALRKMLGPAAAMALCAGRRTSAAGVPIGEVIERGARLLARSSGERILVDEVIGSLLARDFAIEVAPAAPQDAPDAGEQHLVGERDIEDGRRLLLGRPSPFAGRDREMSTLEAVFSDCVNEGRAAAVVVTAPAGGGKTRLRQELVLRIRSGGSDPEVWIARGDPMRAGSPFGMLGQLVCRAAGIDDEDGGEVRQRKLGDRLRRQLPIDDADRAVLFLAELALAPFAAGHAVELDSARHDSTLMNDQTRRAFEEWVGVEATARPLLLVLEDIHWGDPPSMGFIESTLASARERPVMVLALGRPETHQLFPDLWAKHCAAHLRLGELSRKACERLASQVLGDAVSGETIARLVERAEGNPLYLEELIRSVASGKGEAPPETVLAMVQARLGALAEEPRRVLRAASIFGRSFWRAGVSALVGGGADSSGGPPSARAVPDTDPWLAHLVDHEILVREEDGGPTLGRRFAFRHSLARDAAYAMLTDRDASLGHRLAAVWLERTGQADAQVLAEHYERGAEPGRAAALYRRAAEQALEGGDPDAALARVARSRLAGAKGELRGELHRIEAEALRLLGRLAEGERVAFEAVSLLPTGSAAWFAALHELASTSGRLGHQDHLGFAASRLVEPPRDAAAETRRVIGLSVCAVHLLMAGRYDAAGPLLEAAEAAAVTDPLARAHVHQGRAFRALHSGDPAGYLAGLRDAATEYERAGDRRNLCNARANVGAALIDMGASSEAEGLLRDALATAERLGARNIAAGAKLNLARALLRSGKLAAARDLASAAADRAKAEGHKRMECAARVSLAQILGRAGDLDAAESEARAALELAADSPPGRALAEAELASVHLLGGRIDDALREAKGAMATVEALGEIADGSAFVRLTHAEALHAAGRTGEARVAIAAARERLLASAGKVADPAWRERLLKGVPENARTLSLAAEWSPT